MTETRAIRKIVFFSGEQINKAGDQQRNQQKTDEKIVLINKQTIGDCGSPFKTGEPVEQGEIAQFDIDLLYED